MIGGYCHSHKFMWRYDALTCPNDSSATKHGVASRAIAKLLFVPDFSLDTLFNVTYATTLYICHGI